MLTRFDIKFDKALSLREISWSRSHIGQEDIYYQPLIGLGNNLSSQIRWFHMLGHKCKNIVCS